MQRAFGLAHTTIASVRAPLGTRPMPIRVALPSLPYHSLTRA